MSLAIALILGAYTASGIHQYSLLAKNFAEVAPDYSPPTVSIVLPTMNDASIIETSIQSILQNRLIQMYPERFELIVVDAGSDNTKQIAEKYKARHIHVPRGKLLARDTGFQAAQGEIVVGIDSDLYYPPNFLTLLLQPFQDNGVVATAGLYKTVTTNPLIDVDVFSYASAALLYFLRGALIGGANAIRRSAYMAVGGYDLSKDSLSVISMVYYEEVELTDRLRKVGKVLQTGALGLHSHRRLVCMVNPFRCIVNPQDPICDYCKSIGVSRF